MADRHDRAEQIAMQCHHCGRTLVIGATRYWVHIRESVPDKWGDEIKRHSSNLLDVYFCRACATALVDCLIVQSVAA